MTPEELGRQTKAKHPEYAQYPDVVVGQRVLAKYPEYKSHITDSSSSPETPVSSSGLRGAVAKIPGLMDKISPMIPGFAEVSQVARPSEMASIAQKGHEFFPEAGGNIAEELGRRGVNPKIAASVALPVSIAPEIASSVMGINEIVSGPSTIAKAIRTAPKKLGPAFDAGERAAGISGDLPVQRGAMARFPKSEIDPVTPSGVPTPKSYPKDLNSFLNFTKARVTAFGEKLSPQELDDYKTMLGTHLDAMKAKGLAKTEPFAIASKLRNQVTELHNMAIPGREELNKIYAISRKLHGDAAADAVKAFVSKYGKRVLAETAALTLGGAAASRFFK
jgi:hypothetical protein